MDLGKNLGVLGYSTLVYPGDTWAEMKDSLSRYVPAVKKAISPNDPFAVSLRLSGASVATLTQEPDEKAELTEFLANEDLYIYTVNAFPHGPFKGASVMAEVYEPDWASNERTRYTMAVADILAEITPIDIEPTIQSVPLAFKGKVTGTDYIERFTANVLEVAAHLVTLERHTGHRIKLALEPEPFCYLATTQETITYFESHLYSLDSAKTLARHTGLALSDSYAALRRHVGIVFDIGHQAVEFDDIPESLDRLAAAGVPIFKLQEAAALRVPDVTADTVAELRPFTDTIYLSQTTELRDGHLIRFLTLADAIDAWQANPRGRREWRTHFHVPVFLDNLGYLGTTRFGLEQALDKHRAVPQSNQLEIETYTWDVLPAHLKTGDLTQYIVRELEWVRSRLLSGDTSPGQLPGGIYAR